jgi:O-acetylhomoserine (thiol)-lyase
MSDDAHEYGFDTKALHAGQQPDPVTGSRGQPIYQTVAYAFEDPQHAADLFALQRFGNIYSRIMNPTNGVFEERMAALEGGVGALATSSGLAAQALAMNTLMVSGNHVVASKNLYGGTHSQFTKAISRFGISTTFVDPHDLDAWKAAVTDDTKMFFAETVGNPALDVLDIEGVAGVANDVGVPLLVDNTFATPYLCRPFEHGAHLVTHSATKWIGGHGTAIGGVIVDGGNFPWDNGNFPEFTQPNEGYKGLVYYETFGAMSFIIKARVEGLRDLGPAMSPMTAHTMLQGLETLSLRMDRHVENATAVAEFLAGRPEVSWVNYPGSPDSPYAANAAKYLPKGAGAVLTFGIKGGSEAGQKFIENVKLLSHLANVGDAKSLVIHPPATTHSRLSDEDKIAAGVPPDMVRISVGIESIEDLTWDIGQALEASQK